MIDWPYPSLFQTRSQPNEPDRNKLWLDQWDRLKKKDGDLLSTSCPAHRMDRSRRALFGHKIAKFDTLTKGSRNWPKLVIWWFKIHLVNVAYESAFISIIEVGKVIKGFLFSCLWRRCQNQCIRRNSRLKFWWAGTPNLSRPEKAQAESTMERDYEEIYSYFIHSTQSQSQGLKHALYSTRWSTP